MTSALKQSEMDHLLAHLRDLVQEGLDKKHFEFTVRFASHSKEKTCVRVTGGPTHQFVLRSDEIRK